MRQLILSVTLFVCALAFGFTNARAQKPQKIVKEGVEIEFTVEPPPSLPKANELMAGQDAVFRFKIRDTATKTPLSGIKPAAWVAQRERPGPPGPDQCRAKVQSFMQGSLRSRPDVDLNAYYVLALNQEPNISVIDPLLGFGGSKLLTLVVLKSPGEDWALTANRSKLFVSMPRINHVAAVDTTTWKVIADIETGVKPTRVALQPDEKYLWVGDEAGVSVIDTTTLKVSKRITTGAGHHEIVFGADNKFAFVTNRDDGTLSIIDVAKLKKIKDVKTGRPASSLAFSPLSKALYVTNEVDGTITVIDSKSHQLLANIAAKPGLRAVRFAPGGRWGFVPNPVDSNVYIFDASTNRLVHEQAVGQAPDQVGFSDNFAYVRSLGTEQVSAIRLSTVGKQLDMVKFPGGQNAPGSSKMYASSADAFVAAPEAGSMLLTSPADKMIYYYSEGMAAPMGNFQNYRRVPRAVKVVDRSLREETLGVYATTARLPKQGVYNVSLLLDSPRVVHCFEVVATANPAIKPDEVAALRIEYLNKDTSFITGEDHKIHFKLTDTETKRPNSNLKDVGVLVFLPPGNWQQRQIAQPLGDGLYEITLNLPETGVYLLFVESPSKRVAYRHLPYLTLHANSSRQTPGSGSQK
jgi:YVTN family beta-propeller protein